MTDADALLSRVANLMTECGIPATPLVPNAYAIGFVVAADKAELAQALLQRKVGAKLDLAFEIRPRGANAWVWAKFH